MSAGSAAATTGASSTDSSGAEFLGRLLSGLYRRQRIGQVLDDCFLRHVDRRRIHGAELVDGARRGRQDVLVRHDLVERWQVVDFVVTLALRLAVVTLALRLAVVTLAIRLAVVTLDVGLRLQTVERQLRFDRLIVKRVCSRGRNLGVSLAWRLEAVEELVELRHARAVGSRVAVRRQAVVRGLVVGAIAGECPVHLRGEVDDGLPADIDADLAPHELSHVVDRLVGSGVGTASGNRK